MLNDEALKEAIKEVEIKKKPTATWDRCITRRYMDYSITREGKEVMMQFIGEIGEGPFSVDSWYRGMKYVRQAAKEAGFLLVKNKRRGGYALYTQGNDPSKSFTFNPDLLDMEDDTQPEKACMEK